MELEVATNFPLQATIADRGLAAQLDELKNPLTRKINLTLKIWHKVVKSNGIDNMLRLFRWCVYDTEFTPNRMDKRFERWTRKGLTTYLSFTHKGTLQSFKSLQDKHGLEHSDFFRYLEVRHYFNQKCSLTDLSRVEFEFHKILNSAFKAIPKKAIRNSIMLFFY